MSDYQPGEPYDVEVRRDGSRSTLIFVRELRHPPEKVWLALTDPSHLREWAPFDTKRNLGAMGATVLTLAGVDPPLDFECEVRVADEPHVLEYTWGDDLLRWELEPIESGTRLTLRHTMDDLTMIPKSAAGWHMALDICERALDGNPIGRFPARDARKYGWERLNAAYAEQLGIENTGWPDDIVGS